MLRGTTEELIEWCYYVYIHMFLFHFNFLNKFQIVRSLELITDSFVYWRYDLNGDGGLAREELHHCLKGCIYTGYGIDPDELDEAEREIVEIVMRTLGEDEIKMNNITWISISIYFVTLSWFFLILLQMLTEVCEFSDVVS